LLADRRFHMLVALPAQKMIGKTLSHYRISAELSRGGMGIVYRAVDTKLGREIALKVLPPELVQDPDRRERFLREARSAAALESPHIGVIYEIDDAEGLTFLAMELIRGEKLGELMGRARLPPSRALELGIEIAEGLAHAHDRGIVHRDLKPANVMMTEDGHPKIIDFGLAKLVEPLGSSVPRGGTSGETATGLRRETESGIVLGTVFYMSPEQARGEKVDHRSDVFAFGVLLHEMLSGSLPFQRASAVETLNAILNDAHLRLPAPGRDVTPEVALELQRIVDKCLSKDPKDRYQSMKDVVVDLRAVWRRLHSGSVAASPALAAASSPSLPTRTRLWLFGAGAAIVVVAVAVALFWASRSRTEIVRPHSARPSVAVLYFENNTGDPSLDWLRTALTDMMVTDLSQSPGMEILGTDSLYQILKEMNRLDERVNSLEVVREIAERARVETVLVGSFIKAGDTIRVNVRLQEASTGRILSTEHVEGQGETAIFPMVDDLTQRIQARFEVPRVPAVDRDLEEVTTSSVEAYRSYAEGVRLHDQFREDEAIPFLERAVQLDPDFGMALAKLAVIHGNLNQRKEWGVYATRALANADRLTLREKYYIEGLSSADRPETNDRAVEIYRKALETYPDFNTARHNLAVLYNDLELFDDATPHLEELKRRGMNYPETYGMLAENRVRNGDADGALAVLNEYLRSYPASAAGYQHLAETLLMLGRLDGAEDAIARAESLNPGGLFIKLSRLDLLVLQERWPEADAVARSLQNSSDPFRKWAGSNRLSKQAIREGRRGLAIEELEKAAAAYPEPGRFTANAHLFLADLLLETGDAKGALGHAQKARKDGEGDWPAWYAIRPEALAEARLGRWDEAGRLSAELKSFADSLPGRSFEREWHRLQGELALVKGDAELARTELASAVSMLPARAAIRPPPPHVPIWYAYATALIATGRDEEAVRTFQRILDATTERVPWPLHFVRSLYFLGKIYEKQGDMVRAREYYRRFVDLWKDGDIDRERVAEARSKLSAKS
jgi:eukaryotic-like serine/threonine-protein kinase